jgi:hypothetical protein
MAPPQALLLAAALWCLLPAQAPRPAAADGPIVQTIYYYSPPPPSSPGTGGPPPPCNCYNQPAPPQCNCAAARAPPGPVKNHSFSPPKYAFLSGSGRTQQAAAGHLLPLLCAAAVLAWR